MILKGKIERTFLFSLLVVSVYIILLAYTESVFSAFNYKPQGIFITQLLGINFSLSAISYYIFSVATLIVFILISLKFFGLKRGIIPPIIYSISPWFWYLTIAESFYIYLLFWLLLGTYGLLLRNYWGQSVLILSTITLLLSSIFALFLYPVAIILLVVLNLINLKDFKILILTTVITFIVILSLSFVKQDAFLNIFQNRFLILSSSGILTEANRLQGDTKKAGNVFFARMIENRYIYISKYTLNKFLKQLSPSNFFTPQEKLLNFSFSPPILLGFLLPFFIGAYILILNKAYVRYFLLVLLLIFPALVSDKMVDLNRLLLISPFVLLAVSFGFFYLLNMGRKGKVILSLCFLLVAIQFCFILVDMNFNEDARYRQHFPRYNPYDLDRQ